MDPLRIAVRALFAFLLLLTLLRLTGKRFVAQASGFDFVLALIVGDLVDDLLWGEVPAAAFAVGVGTLVVANILVGLSCARVPLVADLASGRPCLIVRDGSPLRPPMRAERVNAKDVAALLRIRGFGERDLPRVKSAWIERSGRLGLLEHDWSRAAQRGERERARRVHRR